MDILSVCNLCRRCCIGTEIRLIQADIDRWKQEERLDILLSINPLLGESRQLEHKESNEECIFLMDNGSCEIQETKPYICVKFPTSRVHGAVMDCKALDILFPKL
ncbi:MAG: YkgJ family cysteine cluster protein [archaeon]